MPYKDPQDPRLLQKRREHYYANKQAYRDRSKAQRADMVSWYRQLKSDKPCTDCGTVHPHYVMQWDHLGDKEHDIGSMISKGFSKTKILTEIAKCELVCANCHAERTWKRSQDK